jgi:hypothetical protein
VFVLLLVLLVLFPPQTLPSTTQQQQQPCLQVLQRLPASCTAAAAMSKLPSELLVMNWNLHHLLQLSACLLLIPVACQQQQQQQV